MNNAILSKAIIFLIALVCLAGVARAQDSSSRKKITVHGNAKTEVINCDGCRIVISGDRHTITVKGYCFEIVVYGDESKLDIESVRLLTLYGNKNKITYKTSKEFKTRLNRFGNYNIITKRE